MGDGDKSLREVAERLLEDLEEGCGSEDEASVEADTKEDGGAEDECGNHYGGAPEDDYVARDGVHESGS